MKTSAGREEKLMASSSWRRANAHNSREEQNLQKEKCRLERQFEREICQLKAAKNRFELQRRKNSTTEPRRKTSVVLPPVHEERDIGGEESDKFLKMPRDRRMSRSLTSLPPLTADVLAAAGNSNVGTRKRSKSVNSAASEPIPLNKLGDGTGETDGDKHAEHRRSKSYSGLNVTSMRLQPLD